MKIQVKDLTAGFHKNPILENVSFEISKGGIWFLLGPNGSGKSTLIKTLGGYITPEKGDILYDDIPIKNIPIKKRAKIIAYMPQKFYSQSMTVEDFVTMGATPYLSPFQQPQKSHREKAKKYIDEMGISHLSQRSTEEISGGELQLACLAKTFTQETDYILLDEPTSGLDVKRQQNFMKKVKALSKDNQNKLIILSVHDPNLALQYGDGILLIKDKKVDIIPKTDKFAKSLLKKLIPVYGNDLNLSEEGFLYWKT